ncbi:hypothetical protein [Sodalis sp. RH22]
MISIWWLIPAVLFSSSIGMLAAALCMSAGAISREIEKENVEVKHIHTIV